MSQEERKQARRYLMFLKEKRDGTIKARDYTKTKKSQAHLPSPLRQ